MPVLRIQKNVDCACKKNIVSFPDSKELQNKRL